MKKLHLLGAVCACILTVSGASSAAQFVFDNSVDGGVSGSYVGPGIEGLFLGGVLDGGRDAFDGYGGVDNLDGLGFHRHTDALEGTNTFRFLDTFTNNTGTAIDTAVRFYGNLGSDGNEDILFSNDFYMTSCQYATTCVGDPVISHVFGNNIFTQNSISASIAGNIVNFNIVTNLTLAPGESASLLFFAFLASEEAGTNHAIDAPLAISTGANLVANPILTGLTQSEIDSIVNFTVVPIPAAAWLFGSGILGLIGMARRKKAV